MDFNKLWQNFLDTITGHYVDFNGRVGRAQVGRQINDGWHGGRYWFCRRNCA